MKHLNVHRKLPSSETVLCCGRTLLLKVSLLLHKQIFPFVLFPFVFCSCMHMAKLGKPGIFVRDKAASQPKGMFHKCRACTFI